MLSLANIFLITEHSVNLHFPSDAPIMVKSSISTGKLKNTKPSRSVAELSQDDGKAQFKVSDWIIMMGYASNHGNIESQLAKHFGLTMEDQRACKQIFQKFGGTDFDQTVTSHIQDGIVMEILERDGYRKKLKEMTEAVRASVASNNKDALADVILNSGKLPGSHKGEKIVASLADDKNGIEITKYDASGAVIEYSHDPFENILTNSTLVSSLLENLLSSEEGSDFVKSLVGG